MNKKKKTLSSEIQSYFGITLGTLIMAFGFNSFSIPNKIAPGGFSGLATVLYHLTGYPVGLVTLIFTIPLFIATVKLLGGRFGVKTLYGTVLLSLSVDIIMRTPPITHDIFLASVFGGVILGAGVGVVFKFGGTTGGTDLLASIMHKYFRGISIGTWLMIIDSLVVIFAGVVFRDIEITLYSTLTMFLVMKVIDLIQEGMSYAKAFYIISSKSEAIAQAILTDMDRGVTLLEAKGGYTGDKRSIVFCVVHRTQIFQMKDLVKQVDPEAFVILGDVYEVLGQGFKEFET